MFLNDLAKDITLWRFSLLVSYFLNILPLLIRHSFGISAVWLSQRIWPTHVSDRATGDVQTPVGTAVVRGYEVDDFRTKHVRIAGLAPINCKNR